LLTHITYFSFKNSNVFTLVAL